MTVQSATLSDGIAVRDPSISSIKANTIGLSEVVVVGNVIDRLHQFVATFTDRIQARAILRAGMGVSMTMRDSLAIADVLNFGLGEVMQDGVRITSRLTADQAIQLREKVQLAARMVATSLYGIAMKSAVRIADEGPTVQFGTLLQSRLSIAANISNLYRGLATLADDLEVHDALGHTLVGVVLLQDKLRITGQELLQGIFNATLSDKLVFALDVIGPDGDLTTWAMNTRTGSVTEYLNYDFNSFAQAASGVYLGANSTGLYELVGDTDAGEPIVADLISGMANFSGTFLTGIKAAYLGIRGSGQFYLKLVEGGGKTYTYGVQASSLRTSRVNIGKGLRAKYFTWELISVGQDFDLNDISFIPLQNTRRV